MKRAVIVLGAFSLVAMLCAFSHALSYAEEASLLKPLRVCNSKYRMLQVPFKNQHTTSWCWAASAEMVMHFHNPSEMILPLTPSQCDQVNDQSGQTNCCTCLDWTCALGQACPDWLCGSSHDCLTGGWPWVPNDYGYDKEVRERS